MYSRPSMADDIPACGCGSGKMVLRCAGRTAMHAGRYYYKCPNNGKHPGSFKWCDEYHSEPGTVEEDKNNNRGSSGRPVQSSIGSVLDGRCTHCCGNKMPQVLTVQGMVGFMALVLILFGIIIGKLM
ncbi:hypothetical protein AAHA92_28920 [Salvia divinorum]|uniref:GRF-type domain-containing protein n=1 Tax=Salvia divinorum TaxID=28513 RepID=A0ABD1FZT4_SALDI